MVREWTSVFSVQPTVEQASSPISHPTPSNSGRQLLTSIAPTAFSDVSVVVYLVRDCTDTDALIWSYLMWCALMSPDVIWYDAYWWNLLKLKICLEVSWLMKCACTVDYITWWCDVMRCASVCRFNLRCVVLYCVVLYLLRWVACDPVLRWLQTSRQTNLHASLSVPLQRNLIAFLRTGKWSAVRQCLCIPSSLCVCTTKSQLAWQNVSI